jgi:diguanylate cyclase (GGDEF)-like protein
MNGTGTLERMAVDHATLILAIACAGTSLSVTALAVWLTTPVDRFLLTWMGGAALIVAHALLYGRYIVSAAPIDLGAALLVLPMALALVRSAAIQFRDSVLPITSTLVSGAIGILVCVTPLFFGLDGLALVGDNTWAGLMLAWTAHDYARQRAASPVQIGAIAALYAICSVAFFACSVELLRDGRMALGAAPVNAVENASAAVWIVCMTGIGGLSVALAQARRAHGHRRDALTDPLTGLLNRRGLVERHGERPMPVGQAILLFDLDRFKEVNDRFGHAIGDRFLIGFAETLNRELGLDGTAARIGGEEFAVVVPATRIGRAAVVDTADRIRRRFADLVVVVDGRPVTATVSAGVAFATCDATDFEERLVAADRSLYDAKRSGRNCVVLAVAA